MALQPIWPKKVSSLIHNVLCFLNLSQHLNIKRKKFQKSGVTPSQEKCKVPTAGPHFHLAANAGSL